MSNKTITQFDVYNAMPENTIDIFMHTGGGKQISKKKGGGAIIEVLVDNDTFQNFAFQKTYGHPKQGEREKFFIMYAVDAEEYQKTLKQLEDKK